MQMMRDEVIANGRWDVNESITEDDKKGIIGWLKVATFVADDYQIQAAKDRIKIIKDKLQRRVQFTQRDCGTELRVLLETIEMGLRNQFIYRYPADKSKVLENYLVDWSACLEAFPSAKEDVSSAVDLWAMGHNTASVFHGMRVLEHGLRALAGNVGVNFGVENWQNILDQIEARIKDASKNLSRGTEKSERLKFLSEAAKEFYYFKDGWRNYVSHNRAKYDEHQARSAIEHVRGFMNIISGQISESAVALGA